MGTTRGTSTSSTTSSSDGRDWSGRNQQGGRSHEPPPEWVELVSSDVTLFSEAIRDYMNEAQEDFWDAVDSIRRDGDWRAARDFLGNYPAISAAAVALLLLLRWPQAAAAVVRLPFVFSLLLARITFYNPWLLAVFTKTFRRVVNQWWNVARRRARQRLQRRRNRRRKKEGWRDRWRKKRGENSSNSSSS